MKGVMKTRYITIHDDPATKMHLNGECITFAEWLRREQKRMARGGKKTHITDPNEKGEIALAHGEQP